MNWLDTLLSEILKAEGWPKYTNRPNDRGGPTKGGITLATLSAYMRRDCTAAELMSLTQDAARAIYTKMFVVDPHFDQIVDSLLRWQVVDAGVMSSPERATKWLQLAADVAVDGKLGPITATRVNSLSPHALALRFAATRIRFLGNLITNDHTHDQRENAAGWMNRATKFIELEDARFRGVPVV